MQETMINISSMTVAEATEVFLSLYGGAIGNGMKLRRLPTPFLWGPPGVGKSESVAQFAEKLEKATRKRVSVTDIRLLLFSPVDIRGVPMADAERKFTNWLKPKIFDLPSGDEYINILFLDELSAAPQSVQAAAYQLCLDRRVGEFELPENTIVIAAGNRMTDKSIAYKMPKALCNRLLHIEIKADFPSWRRWAQESGISDKVIGYLAFDPSRLCVEADNADLAYPTPRSWAFVSSLLEATGKQPSEIHKLIAGCIGEDTAIEFELFCSGAKNIPDISKILAGRCRETPRRHDVVYALLSKLSQRIISDSEKITVEEIDNACTYVLRFPKDFVASFMRDLRSEKLGAKLMRSRVYGEWIANNEEE